MPAEDLYNDGDSADDKANASAKDGQSSSDNDTKTSILPRSFFKGDLKPGDKCEVEIVASHENDYEVVPAGKGESDDENEEPTDEEMPGPADDEAGAAQPTPDDNENPDYQ